MFIYRMISLISLALLLLPACKDQPKEAKPALSLSTNEYLLSQLSDSLNTDTARSYFLQIDSPHFVAWGAMVSHHRIALINNPYESLMFYHFTEGQWKLFDSLSYEDFMMEADTTDLNNDNQTDVVVKGFGNIHGQSRSYVFLAGQPGTWHYRPDLNLFNIRYNKRTGYVEAFYEGGARSLHSKQMYRWAGDSLQLIKRGEQDFQEEEKFYTRIYEMRNGKEIKTLDVEGEDERYESELFPLYY